MLWKAKDLTGKETRCTMNCDYRKEEKSELFREINKNLFCQSFFSISIVGVANCVWIRHTFFKWSFQIGYPGRELNSGCRNRNLVLRLTRL